MLRLFCFFFMIKTFEAFTIVAHLRHHNEDMLEAMFWKVSDPACAYISFVLDAPRRPLHTKPPPTPLSADEYLHFRTVSDLAAIIGSPAADITAVISWLREAGGASIEVSPLRDAVSAVFSDGSHRFVLGANGIPVVDAMRPAAVRFLVRRDAASVSAAAQPRRRPPNVASVSNPTVSEIKSAYGIPLDFTASNPLTTNMVWGPGTFGYSPRDLAAFAQQQAPLIALDKVLFDTPNHGVPGGDNFGEGQLDVKMITSFGLNATTLVSNTNTSASTEETTGFGVALLDFAAELSARPAVPHVLSMSLGSLSAASCDLLCSEVSKMGFSVAECNAYMATQRQVCMFNGTEQTARINTYLQVLGLRGVTVMGSSGDGGSHFSFTKFTGGAIANALNEVSCRFQVPVFPTASPFVLSIGAEMWDGSSKDPVTWNVNNMYGSGGGFSLQFPAPAHQQAAVSAYLSKAGMPPPASFNASNRAYPDVAAIGVDGTSQSCPIWAGVLSLITDMRLNKGLPPLGFVAPRIYQVAAMHPGEAFLDITRGNSGTSCANGFPAAEGWDANTGFGRPVWTGLVRYFASD
jgi:hypothetical protein